MKSRSTDAPAVGRIRPCRILQLAEHADSRGSLSVVESGLDIDFEIRRVYYLYDVPVDAARGAHAHRTLQQVLIVVHGCFEITVDDGTERALFRLDHPSRGLFIGPMVWLNLVNVMAGTVGLVLASAHYDESDYLRDYEAFLRAARWLP